MLYEVRHGTNIGTLPVRATSALLQLPRLVMASVRHGALHIDALPRIFIALLWAAVAGLALCAFSSAARDFHAMALPLSFQEAVP